MPSTISTIHNQLKSKTHPVMFKKTVYMDIQIQITSQMESEYVERNSSTQKHGYTVNQRRVCGTGIIFIRCENEE